MNLKNIGENVKRIRLKKGLTQAQLAELADISTVHMSHVETGSVAMSIDSLINICDALDTTPDMLLVGEYKTSTDGASALVQESIDKLTYDEIRLILQIAELLEKNKINRN
ncbi:MAG: helix-turn-helix transcriptional regulator [Clostridia bacterium]|nr:helix-turn-helix transcriptional regulator [Clostridia bacterium]